jgi:hypothetical protein
MQGIAQGFREDEPTCLVDGYRGTHNAILPLKMAILA